jgi:plastocyanin
MFKNKQFLLLLIVVVMLSLAACGGGRANASAPAQRAGQAENTEANTVHMNDTVFLPTQITIQAGESLTLVADTFMPHIISNGTWQNGAPKPAREDGAPEINNVKIDGNSSGQIGPFEQAGTFQLYCTIHPGMNLTVVVE